MSEEKNDKNITNEEEKVKKVVCVLNDSEFEAFNKTKKKEKKSGQFLIYMALVKSGYIS